MKTLFRGIFSTLVGVIVCASMFLSCTENEDDGLLFDIPGQIVTEFNATVVVPFTSRNIASVMLLEATEINTLDVVSADVLVMTEAAAKIIGEVLV